MLISGNTRSMMRGDTEKELCSPEHNGLTEVGSDRDVFGWTFLCKRARVRRVILCPQRTRPTFQDLFARRGTCWCTPATIPYRTVSCPVRGRHNACHHRQKNGINNRPGVGFTTVGQLSDCSVSDVIITCRQDERKRPLHGQAHNRRCRGCR
jgi:hypothetical protein